MRDYAPLDLSGLCNVNPKDLVQSEIPKGEQSYHGLPFVIGDAEGRVIGRGEKLDLSELTLEVQQTAPYVVFAHRLIDSNLEDGDPVGRACADYVFRFDDGEIVSIPVRERLEIGKIPFPWGQIAILCYAEGKDHLAERYTGKWEQAGARQAEAFQGWPKLFYLWPWKNPRPERRIESITIVPKGPRFFLAAVTLGLSAEYPFNRNAKLDVKLVLTDPKLAEKPFDLAVEVDRGVATFPYPLPAQALEEFMHAPYAGWGQKHNDQSSPAYVQVAANPSATLSVKQGAELVGSVRFGEVLEKGAVDVNPKLRVELIDQGRNWVHTEVLDDETDRPIPCRIHFRSIEGVPYQPHGYHNHVNSELGSWHFDNGGDMRLGQMSYAYIRGECQGWLPRGEVIVDIARGFEYEPIRTKLEIKPGQRQLSFRLKRFANMNRERYFSGDTHVHFLSTQGAHLEAAGEDLNVVNLLQTQIGHLFTDTQEFTGRPSISPDGSTIVYASQENRQHILGHLILLGLEEPVMPWCTDGASEAELGGNLETTVARWADACRAQGGTVVLPHLPNPNGEPAVLVVTGRVDAVEMCEQNDYSIREYYKYLNCGYRLPLTGGTDKMSSDVPVGLYRTYVHIPADEPFTYESWCRNLRLGNTFLSAGPLLSFEVEGRPIGSTLELPGSGGELEVVVTAKSVLPFQCLEIVMNGKVVARTERAEPVRTLELKEKIRVSRHSWLAARCGGPSFTRQNHHDGWTRGIMAHTSPVYVAVGGPWWMFDVETAQYLMTLVHGGLDYIHQRPLQWAPGTVTHHHPGEDHLAYLEQPFREALSVLHRRLHEQGIPH